VSSARGTNSVVDAVIDRGLLPDPALRWLIRRLLHRRLTEVTAGSVEDRGERRRRLIGRLSEDAIAVETARANLQHYEVPAGLFELMLGPHLKYSSGWWPPGTATLAEAEEAMLELTCRHAELADGQDILELGCGWGSLTLWMATRYPASHIVAVSNSAGQRAFIEARAHERGLDNVTVLTVDVNRLGVDEHRDQVKTAAFDRVVSVEMFEHVRNHAALGRRIAAWLRPDGKLFVHVFAHRSAAYLFETGSQADWMARHFFTGGVMPSDDLLLHSLPGFDVEDHWVHSGRHYARTLRAWLERLDAGRDRALALLRTSDGADASAALHRWRVFLIACEELFAFRGGDEWHVSHYRFVRR
jgi:cyclopropane-fatty-acyl-phospholipid synthase